MTDSTSREIHIRVEYLVPVYDLTGKRREVITLRPAAHSPGAGSTTGATAATVGDLRCLLVSKYAGRRRIRQMPDLASHGVSGETSGEVECGVPETASPGREHAHGPDRKNDPENETSIWANTVLVVNGQIVHEPGYRLNDGDVVTVMLPFDAG